MGLENPLHIAVLVVLVLLVFGAKRLPEIGRSLGTGMREFKQSVTGESASPTTTLPAPEQQAPQAPVAQPAQAPAQPAPTPAATPSAPAEQQHS
ncbi:MAG TPA: twin-arginine translocase TatA/TatE family subunit [Solirubrobacteraceae bacterium]|jgi:sec-independent protein translocase protein TatA|nr:twin-arginine translocase TatA/TatE family subunit [Solirubrobacteraceae bacterium]